MVDLQLVLDFDFAVILSVRVVSIAQGFFWGGGGSGMHAAPAKKGGCIDGRVVGRQKGLVGAWANEWMRAWMHMHGCMDAWMG